MKPDVWGKSSKCIIILYQRSDNKVKSCFCMSQTLHLASHPKEKEDTNIIMSQVSHETLPSYHPSCVQLQWIIVHSLMIVTMKRRNANLQIPPLPQKPHNQPPYFQDLPAVADTEGNIASRRQKLAVGLGRACAVELDLVERVADIDALVVPGARVSARSSAVMGVGVTLRLLGLGGGIVGEAVGEAVVRGVGTGGAIGARANFLFFLW